MDYIMETVGLRKAYKDNIVVDDVNMHISKGAIYGFVGPNGAGKSTVMKMILSLIQPDAGEVQLLGEKVTSHSYEIFKNSNLSYRMKGALNKPSFRRLFFSIQMTSLKSTCSVLEAIAKEDFHHRLHTYRYLFCKGSSASPHRFCLGVLKYIECC